MAFLFHGYVKLLQKHTLVTQMVTGGCCSALGDGIYQQGIEKRGLEGHEFFRTRRLMIWGALVFAPCANRWHFFLNSVHVGGKWTSEFFFSCFFLLFFLREILGFQNVIIFK